MDYTTIIYVSLLLVVLRFLYSYLTKPFSYWENIGVPAVPGIPILGSMFDIYTGVCHDVEVERYKKYGRVYGHYENTRPVLNVAEPDLLRKIFVKDFQFFTNRRDFGNWDPITRDMVSSLQGEAWKRVRALMTPAFTSGKLKKMFSIIGDSARTLLKNLTPMAKSGKPVDAKKVFGAFTMDVIASSAFATKLDSCADPNNPFVSAARNAISKSIPWRFVLLFLFPSVAEFFRIQAFDPAASSFFEKLVHSIIEERRKSGKKGNDFLQTMMDASDEINDASRNKQDAEDEDSLSDMGHEEGSENIIKMSNLKVKAMTNNEAVANCVLFFLAGYDTTASTMAFTCYCLALNPSCQEKLISDIDEGIRQNQNMLDYDAVQKMKYLDMVVSETLRLYPPGFRAERIADADYKLGDTGITVKKGMFVGIPIYAIHHDPEFFPEPEKFDPTRFSPGEKAKRDSYTYLPFGAGPRNCVGMRFALIEIKICLAYLFSQFRVKKCPQTKVPIEFYKGQIIMQPKEILLELEERKDKTFTP